MKLRTIGMLAFCAVSLSRRRNLYPDEPVSGAASRVTICKFSTLFLRSQKNLVISLAIGICCATYSASGDMRAVMSMFFLWRQRYIHSAPIFSTAIIIWLIYSRTEFWDSGWVLLWRASMLEQPKNLL